MEGECANLRCFCKSVPRLLARIVGNVTLGGQGEGEVARGGGGGKGRGRGRWQREGEVTRGGGGGKERGGKGRGQGEGAGAGGARESEIPPSCSRHSPSRIYSNNY